jgi:hypothetical protein
VPALASSTEAVQSWAQSAPIVYPSAGQTLDQQASGEASCRTWAQQQTGVYPNQAPPGYYGNPHAGMPMVGGAARSAAIGAVGGAIGGDAGKGAAIGAAWAPPPGSCGATRSAGSRPTRTSRPWRSTRQT